ncbi:hypothetical protein B0H16DRAFT_1742675 [Mycena metata]|uniref:Uncharacterized protein n=1 Tax=Mycena metata TaxID=1033252 RepID=A0AAD7H8A4_9AGAR|nr:hypothetical protein B0H16DRAFT_1742675 [Mycena metata]
MSEQTPKTPSSNTQGREFKREALADVQLNAPHKEDTQHWLNACQLPPQTPVSSGRRDATREKRVHARRTRREALDSAGTSHAHRLRPLRVEPREDPTHRDENMCIESKTLGVGRKREAITSGQETAFDAPA